jgi:YVTN family beta-propeller protein
MVQLYVSQLRRLLEGDEAQIVTRGRGYELRVAPDSVDAVRFARLVDEAARADATPNGLARKALALWRGPPLDDISGEPFAAAEIRRLEDLWLRARELAIDGALAAGRHDAALGELENLVAEHPLRERLQAQRMLALYRCGRQAEALQAYRDARELLVAEIGIEPGPKLRRLHEQMLNQDPALDLPPTTGRPAAAAAVGATRRARRRTALAVASLATLAAVLAFVVLQRDDNRGAAVGPDSVAVIDPRTNEVTSALAVGSGPGPIAAGRGGIYVLNERSQTVSRIDPSTRTVVATAGTGGQHPAGNLVATTSDVWIAEGCQDGSPGYVNRLDTVSGGAENITDAELISLEPAAGGRARTPPSTVLQTGPGCGLAANARSAWATNYVPPGLARVDTDPVTRVAKVGALPFLPAAIAVGAGAVWALDRNQDEVRRLDPNTLASVRVIHVGRDPVAVAADAGTVWVANSGDGSISRIDAHRNLLTKAISVGDDPAAIAVGAGSVWVANSGDGSVSRVDTQTNRVVATIRVGHRPQGILVTRTAVWVTVRS